MMRRNQGFSLLEVLIAIIILTSGVMGICQAFTGGMFASKDSEDVSLAFNIANAKMESLKDISFAFLTSGGPTVDPNFPNFNVTTTVTQIATNLKQVDVNVSWNVNGGPTGIVLTELATNH